MRISSLCSSVWSDRCVSIAIIIASQLVPLHVLILVILTLVIIIAIWDRCAGTHSIVRRLSGPGSRSPQWRPFPRYKTCEREQSCSIRCRQLAHWVPFQLFTKEIPMPRPQHYSPAIERFLVSVPLSRSPPSKMPMTRLVDDIIKKALTKLTGVATCHTIDQFAGTRIVHLPRQ